MNISEELKQAAMTLIIAQNFFERLIYANMPSTIEEMALAKIQYDMAMRRLKTASYNYNKLLLEESDVEKT